MLKLKDDHVIVLGLRPEMYYADIISGRIDAANADPP